MSDHAANASFRSGRYDEAAAKLRDGLKEQGENGRDLLLYLLDLGLTLHSAGKYDESNEVLLRADKIAEIKDYTSLATEGGTLVTGENVKDYKGEDFEKVLINTYLAMNYALMGDSENALVEARRVNRKLHLMVTDGQRKYKQNAFARYLSAVLYEADRNFNDAYIDYKQTLELAPDYQGLGCDLWRTAKALRMNDEVARWAKQFELAADECRVAKAEIVVLYENGISPVKRPHPGWSSLPKFYPRHNPVARAVVAVDGKSVATTATLHDIEATAIENLDEKYAGIVAKRVAGLVTKEILIDQVERRTNSPLLGFLTRVALYASDQADLRSWNLLPKDLQLARIPVEPGTYTVQAQPIGDGALESKTVQVKAGQKIFVNFRYMP